MVVSVGLEGVVGVVGENGVIGNIEVETILTRQIEIKVGLERVVQRERVVGVAGVMIVVEAVQVRAVEGVAREVVVGDVRSKCCRSCMNSRRSRGSRTRRLSRSRGRSRGSGTGRCRRRKTFSRISMSGGTSSRKVSASGGCKKKY